MALGLEIAALLLPDSDPKQGARFLGALPGAVSFPHATAGLVGAAIAAYAAARVIHSRNGYWAVLAVGHSLVVGVSGSRIALASLAVAIVLCGISKWPRVALAMVVVSVFAAGIQLSSADPFGTASLVDRLGLWASAGLMLVDFPLTGVGFGGFQALLPTYHDPLLAGSALGPHNVLLATWLQTGLPGLLGLIGWCWVMVVAFMGGRDRPFAWPASIAAIVIAFQGVLENTFTGDVMSSVGSLVIVSPLPWLLLAEASRPDRAATESAIGSRTSAGARV